MRKILILTAGFDESHSTAARNVAEALESISDDAKVEVLDLFQTSGGLVNGVLKKAYLGLTRLVPGVLNGTHSGHDNSNGVENKLFSMSDLKAALEQALEQSQPDCVVSTYPIYAQVIKEIYRDQSARPFRLITCVTDSMAVHSSWFRAPGDWFCVPNEAAAEVARKNGVAAAKIKTFGFPVHPAFAEKRPDDVEAPGEDGPIKILYIIDNGKKKSAKAIQRLLEVPRAQLTVTVLDDAELKEKLARRAEEFGGRVRVFGWTNQMPRLMMTHHIVVTKAAGSAVQEAIAARCPMILNQADAQQDGNAELVKELEAGEVVEKNREVAECIANAFSNHAKIWKKWRDNLAKVSHPDASLRIAELALRECEEEGAKNRLVRSNESNAGRSARRKSTNGAPEPRMLVCDFHIHTNYSDGKLTAPEVVDFYGRRGFDCICITDHLVDPRRLVGKLSKLRGVSLGPEQLDEYFEVMERERQRAWRKYNMLLLTGLEFNKDADAKKTSAHLLGIDLKRPVDPSLDLPQTIAEIHAQGGLAVASHPHTKKSDWGKNTLYLWKNQDAFAPLIDAWEIANRNNIFTPGGLKRLAFLANSDFHKPKHIYSWKTLLHCEKDAEAIKECIRKNERLAITLYRDDLSEQAVVGAETVVKLEMPPPLRSLSA